MAKQLIPPSNYITSNLFIYRYITSITGVKMSARPKIGIVVGIACLALAISGIAAMSTLALPSGDSTALEVPALVKPAEQPDRNPAYESTIVKEKLPIELSLESMADYVNDTRWNEYTITVTNPNTIDLHRTIYLKATQYEWDGDSWSPGSEKTVVTLTNITVHPGDTVSFTVPVQLEANGERSFYVFKTSSEEVA